MKAVTITPTKSVLTGMIAALLYPLCAQLAYAADKGSAAISVVVEGAAPPASFMFEGIINGSVMAGASISTGNLTPGDYAATESGGTPGYELVSISCDDDNSQGHINTRTSRFIIDGDESVNCVYLYRQTAIDNAPSGPAAPTTPATSQPDEPQESAPEPDSPVTGACPPPDRVPRAGVWMVSNLPGTMVCGPMNMPLKPSREPGTLTIKDCGWTVVGSGFSDDTADLTMRATDSSGSQYKGTIGGMQDGIPMEIDFTWSVQSDSFITGDLHSEVTQQGMTCRMSRPYEMKFTGG